MSIKTVGLIGAGAIGRAHLNGAARADGVKIVGVADPSPAAAELAREFGVVHFTDHRMLLDALQPDGAIVATPNALHVSIALEWIAAGKPVLVEKPVADTVEEGRRLARAAADAKVPMLVGHHRRHNPIAQTARSLVRDGVLGRLVSATVLATFFKPDAYFDQGWRRTLAAGPVLINLIHEIDLLRFICGEIAGVQAVTSNKIRRFEVEDTAAVVLTFVNGAVATITLSDTAAAPWAWDIASGENPAFPKADAESHFLCGTEASVALPTLRLWRYGKERGWSHTLQSKQVPLQARDPYIEQMRHFGAVIRGDEQPVVDGVDATRTLEVTLAIRQAARSGSAIHFQHA